MLLLLNVLDIYLKFCVPLFWSILLYLKVIFAYVYTNHQIQLFKTVFFSVNVFSMVNKNSLTFVQVGSEKSILIPLLHWPVITSVCVWQTKGEDNVLLLLLFSFFLVNLVYNSLLHNVFSSPFCCCVYRFWLKITDIRANRFRHKLAFFFHFFSLFNLEYCCSFR